MQVHSKWYHIHNALHTRPSLYSSITEQPLVSQLALWLSSKMIMHSPPNHVTTCWQGVAEYGTSPQAASLDAANLGHSRHWMARVPAGPQRSMHHALRHRAQSNRQACLPQAAAGRGLQRPPAALLFGLHLLGAPDQRGVLLGITATGLERTQVNARETLASQPAPWRGWRTAHKCKHAWHARVVHDSAQSIEGQASKVWRSGAAYCHEEDAVAGHWLARRRRLQASWAGTKRTRSAEQHSMGQHASPAPPSGCYPGSYASCYATYTHCSAVPGSYASCYATYTHCSAVQGAARCGAADLAQLGRLAAHILHVPAGVLPSTVQAEGGAHVR